MDKNTLVAILIIAAIALIYIVVKVLATKYGKEKVGSVISDVKEGIETANTMVDNLSVFLPPTIVNIADAIIKYSYVIVSAVEQGYKKGAIEKEIRKDAAMEKMLRILKLAGIEVTEEMTPVIDDAIESAVSHLPKTHEETKSKSVKK